MNYKLLLQSIKSVSGWLAICTIVLLLTVFILENLTPVFGAVLVISVVYGWLVWFDYKNRISIEALNRTIKKTK